MNVIQHAVYGLFQVIARVSTPMYFRKILYLGKEHLDTEAPFILVCNHPNTLMDALLPLMYLREKCYILANYGLFKHPLSNWFFSSMCCLPVQRPKDLPDGTPINNQETFKRSNAHLASGGNLFVAIEGTSSPERVLRPFKTGTARIAFSAVESQPRLALKILPVGLNYYKPSSFRGLAIVRLGQPIEVSDWWAAYNDDPRAAAIDFTAHIKSKVSELVIDCNDIPEDEMLYTLSDVMVTAGRFAESETYHTEVLHLQQGIKGLRERSIDDYESLRHRAELYSAHLESLSLKDIDMNSIDYKSLLWFVGLPLLCVAWLQTGVMAWLSHRIQKMAGFHHAYTTTVRYGSALVLVLMYWVLQVGLIGYLTAGWAWAAAYAATLLPLAWFALPVYDACGYWWNYLRLRYGGHYEEVMAMRDALRADAVRCLREG